MSMKSPELLSPAGTYEGFIGAINAGADAVYFGGTLYSARAFADNFDVNQAVRAIRYAGLFSVRTYLTVNTLTDERELEELPGFLQPYADAGLTGVIVQDLGVLHVIRERFPDLELHASTQMAVTGVYGAKLLKRHGVSRVVPARELSLYELKQLREKAKVEVEAFIHGSMCYAYSGLCLFSGMIGGRSGNRGRCAGSCRLPYKVENSEPTYCLSMKDLNSLADLPALIEAGIDSFKIEGRMKKPEYTAGVTAMYRKYIDRYMSHPDNYRIDQRDLDILRGLYQRTQLENGYLHRHNGKELITMGLPGYAGTDEQLLESIRRQYIEILRTKSVDMYCTVRSGQPVSLTVLSGETAHTEEGIIATPAKSKPMGVSDVKKQLSKLGDTFFSAGEIHIDLDEDSSGVFVPVSALNELRRKALTALEERLIHETV